MDALAAVADRHFRQHLSLPLEQLLAPIDAGQPAGHDAKSAGVYQAIQDARREDDPTLPQGPWAHELKRADWKAVARAAGQALQQRSKDLQLAAWLLEADIHRHGFAGLAPGLVLLEQLLGRFRDQLHPHPGPEGCEHRANVLRWVNRKLLPAIRQVPLTAAGGEREFGWADREAAWRLEQRKAGGPPESGASTWQEVATALARTPSAQLQAGRSQLREGIAAGVALAQAVDGHFGNAGPSVAGLLGLLEQIEAGLAAELRRRGEAPSGAADAEDEAGDPAQPEAAVARAAPAGITALRAQAYAMLEEAGAILLETDPHSPVPSLVQLAVSWGALGTAELYDELFIRRGGQIGIFDLLGLEVARPPQE